MYINKPKLRIIMIDAVILLFFIAVFSYAGLAYAKDLGVYGNSYRISEEDVEEEIGRKLKIFEQSGELKKFQEKYQKEVVRQIKEPNRVVGIKNAEENRTRKYDPTSYLEEDIVVPKDGMSAAENIKNKKEIEYEILHLAGTAINPLKYMRFNEPLIFIDGRNEEQLKFARRYQDENKLSKIILIDGSPGFVEIEGKEYYYFFDQWGAYSERFKIVNVPSIVWQKEGEETLTIDEIYIKEKEDV